MSIFSKRKKTPAELIKIRGRIKNNISAERIQLGIAKQYKQLHDPEVATRILLENLNDLRKTYKLH